MKVLKEGIGFLVKDAKSNVIDPHCQGCYWDIEDEFSRDHCIWMDQ